MSVFRDLVQLGLCKSMYRKISSSRVCTGKQISTSMLWRDIHAKILVCDGVSYLENYQCVSDHMQNTLLIRDDAQDGLILDSFHCNFMRNTCNQVRIPKICTFRYDTFASTAILHALEGRRARQEVCRTEENKENACRLTAAWKVAEDEQVFCAIVWRSDWNTISTWFSICRKVLIRRAT